MSSLHLRALPWALCAWACLATAAVAAPWRYEALAIASPAPTGQSLPTAVNRSGQVAGGFYSPSAHGLHGYATSRQAGPSTDICASLPVCWANGINDSGQVAGYRREAGSILSLAIVVQADGRRMRDLGTLGGDVSVANAINGPGRVAGQSNLVVGGPLHAFVTGSHGRHMRDLGTLGGEASQASSINGPGDVVGTSQLPDGETWHVFAAPHGGGPLRDLGTLGGTVGFANHVNDLGNVVGGAMLANGESHAFVGRIGGGGLVDLGSLSDWSFATAINDVGTIVGRTRKPDTAQVVAFVIQSGPAKMTELDSLTDGLPAGVVLIDAADINERGEIAAQGSDGYGYLLRPIWHSSGAVR